MKRPPTKPRPQQQWAKSKFKYSGSAWIKLRNHKRTMNPLCEHCEAKGLIVPMTEVDHIKPIEEGGDQYDINNLQSLCTNCHRVKSAKEIHKRMR